MNHLTTSGSDLGGISHEVESTNAECFAAVSTQRLTSAYIASLDVFSNLVASTLPIATARPRDTSMNRASWSTWSVGSACWSRSNENVVKPQRMTSSKIGYVVPQMCVVTPTFFDFKYSTSSV